MTACLSFILMLAIGLALLPRGRGTRRRRGLSDGHTLDLDGRNPYSGWLGLPGRPDRVFDDGGVPIP